jgi:protein gp37
MASRFWKDRKFTEVRIHPERLGQPLDWGKPARVFVNSMSDLFHEDVPDEFIDNVFVIMAAASHHKFLILTKRPLRMKKYLNNLDVEHLYDIQYGCYDKGLAVEDWPLPNVWLGVSVEDQKTADQRIPLLLQTPAAVRFVSCEPLLGEVDLKGWIYKNGMWVNGQNRIDWIIVGGESGKNARPMHPGWVRSIRNQCVDAGVPFFFKQWGEWHYDSPFELDHRRTYMDRSGSFFGYNNQDHYDEGRLCFGRVGKKKAGRLLDGREWNEFPMSESQEVV